MAVEIHSQIIKGIDVPCWVKRMSYWLKDWYSRKTPAGQTSPGAFRLEIENLIWQYYRNNPVYSALEEHKDAKELESTLAKQNGLSGEEDIEDRIAPLYARVRAVTWMFQMETLVDPNETLLHRPGTVKCKDNSECECYAVELDATNLKTVFRPDKVVSINSIGEFGARSLMFNRVAEAESKKKQSHLNRNTRKANTEGDANDPIEIVVEPPFPMLLVLPGANKHDIDVAYKKFSEQVNQQLCLDLKNRQNNLLADFMVHYLRKDKGYRPAETKDKLKKLTGLAWEQKSQDLGLKRFEKDSHEKVPYIFSNWINQVD